MLKPGQAHQCRTTSKRPTTPSCKARNPAIYMALPAPGTSPACGDKKKEQWDLTPRPYHIPAPKGMSLGMRLRTAVASLTDNSKVARVFPAGPTNSRRAYLLQVLSASSLASYVTSVLLSTAQAARCVVAGLTSRDCDDLNVVELDRPPVLRMSLIRITEALQARISISKDAALSRGSCIRFICRSFRCRSFYKGSCIPLSLYFLCFRRQSFSQCGVHA